MTRTDGGTPDLPDDRPTYPLEHLLDLPSGRRAEWEAIGDGPPLLWIEGGPGLPAHLARPEARLFADRFRFYLVNAPGCGRSTPSSSSAGYGLDDHVRHFDEVRRALGLGAVTLMGHSFGGLVAIALALAAPEAVERLVIISGYAGEASVPEDAAAAERDAALDRLRDQPWFTQAVAAFDEEPALTSRELDERFEACWPLYFADADSPASKEHIARLRRETRWNIDADRAWTPEPRLDLLPELGRIHRPTLVVAGQHDFICGPGWNRPIAAAIPGATYEEIRGVGHFPQYEAPGEFRRLVLDWIGFAGGPG